MANDVDRVKASELNRGIVINRLLASLGGQNYLEIGVSQGRTLIPTRAKLKIGVDPKPKMPIGADLRSSESLVLYRMTSDEFFLRAPSILQNKKIDVALVDGLHTYEQAYKDVLNCLDVLSPRGVIVMHDCSPPSARLATPASSISEALKTFPDDGDRRWSGDVWKAVLLLRSLHTDIRTFVLDSDFGLGIVTRGQNSNPLPLSLSEIEAMGYQDLDTQREYLLDLRSPSTFDDFLQMI